MGFKASRPDISEMYQIWYDRNLEFLEERYFIES